MEREIFLMGEDIQSHGGPVKVNEGLTDRFGKDRLLDMPISESAVNEAFSYLGAPIERITAPDTPVSFSAAMEKFFIPQIPEIVERIRKMVS
jgi:pyruvate/2-oxoglutarate/acetoin dehydrogenase E1 component